MYEFAAFFLILLQLSNLATIYSLEMELFKQSMYYHIHRGYQYAKYQVQQLKKWFYPTESPKQPEKKQIERYEDKYKERFDALETTQIDMKELESLKNNILLETTPNGNVIMFYNSEKNAFEYYSDKIIPYRFLDTVGRKYVVQFRCKSIFTDKTILLNEKNPKSKVRYIKEANRYICLGKIANFSFLQRKKKHNKLLSFKDYKNMI